MPDKDQLRQFMRVAIVDYGMGNLGSVSRALGELGVEPLIAESPGALEDADRIILPGVGGFLDGMTHLRERGWVNPIRAAVLERGMPILGICLGMQLFATASSEGGSSSGLDLIPGQVERLDTLGCELRIPHVGWNSVAPQRSSELMSGLPSGTDFYFVHSFALKPRAPEHSIACTEYGVPFVAAVEFGPIFGTQFHPEKSSRAGARVLSNFLRFRSC